MDIDTLEFLDEIYRLERVTIRIPKIYKENIESMGYEQCLRPSEIYRALIEIALNFVDFDSDYVSEYIDMQVDRGGSIR